MDEQTCAGEEEIKKLSLLYSHPPTTVKKKNFDGEIVTRDKSHEEIMEYISEKRKALKKIYETDKRYKTRFEVACILKQDSEKEVDQWISELECKIKDKDSRGDLRNLANRLDAYPIQKKRAEKILKRGPIGRLIKKHPAASITIGIGGLATAVAVGYEACINFLYK